MQIRNVSFEQLNQALATANLQFDNNLTWNKIEHVGQTRQHGEKWLVTLRVKDSHAKGARLGFAHSERPQRHLISACWHAHGTFFDSLPEGCEIVLAGGIKTRPNAQWQDRNIGSEYHPLYFSEACECTD